MPSNAQNLIMVMVLLLVLSFLLILGSKKLSGRVVRDYRTIAILRDSVKAQEKGIYNGLFRG
jgi:hypothetical protein